MSFKNILSVVPVAGGYAVAVDNKPTGQVYTTKAEATYQKEKIQAERKAKREAAKTTKNI